MAKPFLLTLIAAATMATALSAAERYTVKRGTEVVIAEHVGWTSKCKARKPQVKFATKPQLGTVKIQRAKVAVPKTATIGDLPSKCIGKVLNGVVLRYTPGDKAGTETLVYELGYQGVSKSRQASVQVTVK